MNRFCKEPFRETIADGNKLGVKAVAGNNIALRFAK
jgi:hypothetical protein